MKRADLTEAQRLLSELVTAVQRGDLAADGPAAVALVRRLEGALLALRAQQGGSAADWSDAPVEAE